MKSPKIMYLRDPHNDAQACIAYTFDKKTGSVRYSFSQVHPMDTFKKSLARQTAIGRLFEGVDCNSLEIASGSEPRQVMTEVVKHLSYKGKCSYTRTLAKHWLAVRANLALCSKFAGGSKKQFSRKDVAFVSQITSQLGTKGFSEFMNMLGAPNLGSPAI